MERLTLRDDDGRALLTPYGLKIYSSTQATADCICKLEEALKAQEPGKVNVTITQSDGWKEGNCPFCGMKVDSFYNWSFCGTCGKGLKWE